MSITNRPSNKKSNSLWNKTMHQDYSLNDYDSGSGLLLLPSGRGSLDLRTSGLKVRDTESPKLAWGLLPVITYEWSKIAIKRLIHFKLQHHYQTTCQDRSLCQGNSTHQHHQPGMWLVGRMSASMLLHDSTVIQACDKRARCLPECSARR